MTKNRLIIIKNQEQIFLINPIRNIKIFTFHLERKLKRKNFTLLKRKLLKIKLMALVKKILLAIVRKAIVKKIIVIVLKMEIFVAKSADVLIA